jgi:hypothetical protein
MCLQLDYEKLTLMGHQSCLWVCLAMFLTSPFGALILLGMLREKKFISASLSKIC